VAFRVVLLQDLQVADQSPEVVADGILVVAQEEVARILEDGSLGVRHNQLDLGEAVVAVLMVVVGVAH
jgi:hypothetical protein